MKKKIFFAYKLKNLISIHNVVSAHTRTDNADYVYEGEQHNFWELVYVIDGNLLFSLDKEKAFELKKNELLIIAPNSFHAHRCNKIQTTYCILSFYCNSEIMKVFGNKIFAAPLEVKKIISDIQFETTHTFSTGTSIGFESAMQLVEEPLVGGEQMLRIHLERLFILLFRKLQPERNEFVYVRHEQLEKEIVKNTISFLEANLYEKITIRDVQHGTGYSRTYICEFFKKHTGETIMKYFATMKVEEAKRLLLTTRISVNEIAEKLNFDTPQHFAITFKRIAHSTPTQYRKSASLDC